MDVIGEERGKQKKKKNLAGEYLAVFVQFL